MSVISWIMAIFAIIGAIDRIIGNKLGLGQEFEKGIYILGTMMMSMVGMIVLAPVIAELLKPVTSVMTGLLDPSIMPAMLFANDMGGASLSTSMANNELLGKFNGLVVSTMMGCTLTFTIPYAVGVVPKEKHKNMFLGILCGMTTIPIGCFIGGLVLNVPFVLLVVDLLPIIVLSGLIVFGLIKFPNVCVKIFSVLGFIIKVMVTVGLVVGIFEFLTGVKLIPFVAPLSEGTDIIINATCVMAGAFPLIKIISFILTKPLTAFGKLLGVNNTSAVGFISSLATNVTTFGIMQDMDDKGIIYNSAFSVSASFVFAGHLAFTLAYSADCVPAVIVSKLIAGVTSILVAYLIFGRKLKTQPKAEQISMEI